MSCNEWSCMIWWIILFHMLHINSGIELVWRERFDRFLFASILWVEYSMIQKNWSSWIHALFDYNHDTKIIMVMKLRVKEDSNHILSDKLILKLFKYYCGEKQWEQTPTITHLLCASNDIWTLLLNIELDKDILSKIN